MTELACPCGQGLYQTCCEPLHQGQSFAQTAEQLMRSRYSAFAQHKIDYLLKTTALGQQAFLDADSIREWAVTNQWQKLEVLNHHPKLDKTHAQVEFKAHYHDGQQIQIHHEISNFVNFESKWYFLDPTLDQKITMKQACICGSGKKFKQCCAQYV